MKQHKPFFLLLALAGLVILTGVSSCRAQSKPTIAYRDAFLVDVRTPEEFAAGSVEGAVNIPLQEIEGRIAEFRGKENIVVFCRSGSRSTQAKQILERNGITRVINGGTWQQVRQQLLHEK